MKVIVIIPAKAFCLCTFLFSQPHLRSQYGLKENLCGGDITLVFHHRPSLADCDESVLSKLDSLKELTEQVRVVYDSKIAHSCYLQEFRLAELPLACAWGTPHTTAIVIQLQLTRTHSSTVLPQ